MLGEVTNINMSALQGIKISLGPNPVSTDMMIQLYSPLDEDLTLEILDLSGVKYREEKLPEGEILYKINVSDLPAGMFLFRFRTNNSSQTEKVCKY